MFIPHNSVKLAVEDAAEVDGSQRVGAGHAIRGFSRLPRTRLFYNPFEKFTKGRVDHRDGRIVERGGRRAGQQDDCHHRGDDIFDRFS